jgi:hypothetical protein
MDVKWWRALFAWRTVKENSAFTYQVNLVTGRRRVVDGVPHVAIRLDRQWLETGVWTPGLKPFAFPCDIGAPSASPEIACFGGPVEPEDIAWLRMALRAQTPVGHCGESSAAMIVRQRCEERTARILTALEFHVPAKGREVG